MKYGFNFTEKWKENLERINENLVERNLISTMIKNHRWQTYLETCCTPSADGTLIPNSLLKDFPGLIDYTMPSSMK